MKKQLVFIDDSGDPGSRNGTNSSSLVMAGVVFIGLDEVRRANEAISAFRKRLGWKDEHEFKFRKVSKEIKVRFLEIVNRFAFEVYAIYIDKAKYPTNFRLSNREKLYDWTIKELLKIIPMNEAIVKIDGGLSRKHKLKVRSNIRKEINTEAYKIREIKAQDSVKDNLIQLADMVVGSVHRSLQPDKTDAKIYIRIIKQKIKEIRQLDLD